MEYFWKFSDEIWLRNERLPVDEGLYELYIWFCKERGYEKEVAIDEINLLGGHMKNLK